MLETIHLVESSRRAQVQHLILVQAHWISQEEAAKEIARVQHKEVGEEERMGFSKAGGRGQCWRSVELTLSTGGGGRAEEEAGGGEVGDRIEACGIASGGRGKLTKTMMEGGGG
eukprot:289738-Hanusia_phi.AAC.1